jgi:apolipoprotein N-acyltransferase
MTALPLAAGAGLLYCLGFIGFGFYPLVFVAWVPMLYAMRTMPPARAFALGVLFGTVANLGGYYWMVHTLSAFGQIGRPLAILALLLLAVYQGTMIALVAYGVRRAESDLGVQPVWTLPAMYMVVELLYPQLFPANIGAALYRASVLTQIVDVTGMLGLTALVALVNGAAWELLQPWTTGRPASRRRVMTAAAVVLAVVLYGLARLPMIDAQMAAAPKLKVALIQTNIGGATLDRRNQVVARHRAMSEQALADEPDVALLVWPESVSAALPRDVPNIAGRVTEGLAIPVIFGGVTYERASGRRHYYNTALLTSPTADVVARFDKMRLVPFSEALPPIASWAGLDALVASSFSRASVFDRGQTFAHFRVGDTVLLPTICYEAIFPDFVRDFWRRAGPADVLINITNDSWFGDTHEPRIHLALASFRAIETRRAMIRSTNTGISALIDPAGRIYRHTEQWTPAVLTGAVPVIRSDASSLYQALGDVLGWLGAGLVAVGWVASARVRARATDGWRRPAWCRWRP